MTEEKEATKEVAKEVTKDVDSSKTDKSDVIAQKKKDGTRMCLGGLFSADEILKEKNKLKKAKKTKEQKQKEKTKFAKQLCETSDDYYKLVKETYFENYYDSIKELTFPTKYINLSKENAKILMNLYKKYDKCNNKNEFKYEINNELKNLINEIDKIKKIINENIYLYECQ